MCWGKRGLGFSKASLPFIYSTNAPKQRCFVFGFQNFELRAHPSSTAFHCLSFCCRVQCWECISAGMAKPSAALPQQIPLMDRQGKWGMQECSKKSCQMNAGPITQSFRDTNPAGIILACQYANSVNEL